MREYKISKENVINLIKEHFSKSKKKKKLHAHRIFNNKNVTISDTQLIGSPSAFEQFNAALGTAHWLRSY
jgi:hypothetical protein